MTEAEQFKLVCYLHDEGYRDMRWIGGVLCGTSMQFVTYGLVVNISEGCYERRYCYETYADAKAALLVYTDPSKDPSGPWIKVKGIRNGMILDDLNPNFGKEVAATKETT